MSLDEKPDFSEPELSEDDMKRLSQMGLDNIIEQVTSDSSTVDDLFENEHNTAAQSDDTKNAQDTDTSSPADNSNSQASAADKKSHKKDKKKNKEKKNNIFSVIKNVFFESLDEEEENPEPEKPKKNKKSKKSEKNISKEISKEVPKEREIQQQQTAAIDKSQTEPENEIFAETIEKPAEESVEESVNQSAAESFDEPVAEAPEAPEGTVSNSENQEIKDSIPQDTLPHEPDRSKDENVQLIKEMYGDKDNLDENIAPKKGLIAKIKYRLAQMKKKNAEEDRLEEEAEQRDLEEQKKKKEEKQAALAVKKENSKKEKEAKAAEKQKAKEAKAAKKAEKPKKEKKPKPEPKPGDILKIKPKSIILFVTLIASVVVLISLLNTTVNYTTAVSKAKTNLENGDYAKVYEALSGMKLNKNDETLYRQATLITYVTRQYESYQNYMEMDMKTEAINALVKGLARYDTYYNEANSLGVGSQMKDARAEIIKAFNDSFKISESEAASLVVMSNENFTQYYRKIESYSKK